MKATAVVEAMTEEDLRTWGELCGWALARGHARSGDPVGISGYLGQDDAMAHALATFAVRYAHSRERARPRRPRDGDLDREDRGTPEPVTGASRPCRRQSIGLAASETACKPSSVPSSLTATVIHLGPRSPVASSGRPESGATHPCPDRGREHALLFGLAPGRACRVSPDHRPCGRHRLVSVALVLASRRTGVTRYPASRCSDFPRTPDRSPRRCSRPSGHLAGWGSLAGIGREPPPSACRDGTRVSPRLRCPGIARGRTAPAAPRRRDRPGRGWPSHPRRDCGRGARGWPSTT